MTLVSSEVSWVGGRGLSATCFQTALIFWNGTKYHSLLAPVLDLTAFCNEKASVILHEICCSYMLRNASLHSKTFSISEANDPNPVTGFFSTVYTTSTLTLNKVIIITYQQGKTPEFLEYPPRLLASLQEISRLLRGGVKKKWQISPSPSQCLFSN